MCDPSKSMNYFTSCGPAGHLYDPPGLDFQASVTVAIVT